MLDMLKSCFAKILAIKDKLNTDDSKAKARAWDQVVALIKQAFLDQTFAEVPEETPGLEVRPVIFDSQVERSTLI